MDRVAKWWLLAQLTLGLTPREAYSATFKITTPYSTYICPEGQNVTLTCKLSGSLANRHDHISRMWFFTNQGDRSCSQRKHVRNVMFKDLHHELGKHHSMLDSNNMADKDFHGQRINGVEISSDHHGTFHITVENLTLQDSGHYCCYAMEINKEHKVDAQQQAHGFMELHVQKANGTFPNCTFYPAASTETESITAAALATGACVVGILCLPLILLLIYKQRQAVTNRRAHELVRMESSNAHGIENPVFDDIPTVNSESKPRPQLTYMARRQPSESGRHLLSEPNTPISPPGTGDCFFPSLEPVPDSPELSNV